MSKLKVGIAGYGIVGKKRRQCVEKNKNLKLVAICDQIFKKDTIDENGIKIFTNYKNLINTNIDLIIVCMSNDIVSNVVVDSLKKNIHVFCEKPPGQTVSDIKKVIEVEKKYPKLKLMYGFNHRYHDSITKGMEIIKSKKLGKIINLRGVYGKSKVVTFDQTNWRTKREIAGGGILLDQGIHLVDLMRMIAGEFTDIKSFVSNNYWKFDVEDNVYVIMKTDDDIVGMLHSSATQWKHRFNLEVNLEKGSVIFSGILSGSKSYGSEKLTVINVKPKEKSSDIKEITTSYKKDYSWDRELEYFTECILTNKKIKFSSSKDALKTMKLVNNIYYSDKVWRTKYGIQHSDQSI